MKPTLADEVTAVFLAKEEVDRKFHEAALAEYAPEGYFAIIPVWVARLHDQHTEQGRLDELNSILASLPQSWQLQAEPTREWVVSGIPLKPEQLEHARHWLQVGIRKTEERIEEDKRTTLVEHADANQISAGIPKLRWLWSQRALIRLFGSLCLKEAIPFYGLEKDEIPWADLCKHWMKDNGNSFDPKILAAEWGKIRGL